MLDASPIPSPEGPTAGRKPEAGPKPEATGFLYPFLEATETDAEALLIDLAGSARMKADTSASLRASVLGATAEARSRAAVAMAAAFASGGHMFTFGNGGSSTDAASVAALFSRPPWGTSLAARCLVEDTAILTALGNDVGFDLVFSRQLIAHARSGDIAVAFSTSGNSRNVLMAFAEARKRGLTTIGFAGYDGGDMGRSGDVEHCLVVPSESVHRVQEVQAALAFALWEGVQAALQLEPR